MRLFRRSPRIEGYLGYFGLSDWWLNSFTVAEQQYVLKVYKPMGSSSHMLIQGKIGSTTTTRTNLLSGVAGWFNNPKDRHLAQRFLEKASEFADDPVVDRHFLYQGILEVSYPERDTNPKALPTAIRACESMIAIAPQVAKQFRSDYKGQPLPRHKGFEQLAIVREKQGDYESAIKLAQQAAKQGWSGDWNKRIQRCQKHLAKTTLA